MSPHERAGDRNALVLRTRRHEAVGGMVSVPMLGAAGTL
jgi:hypothetical protein